MANTYYFLIHAVWDSALSVLLALLLHPPLQLLQQRLLNLDRRELQEAKPTRAAAVIGTDRFEPLAAR